MNVIDTVKLLEEAAQVYAELKDSGLIADIQASIEKDKEIIGKLQGNTRAQTLLTDFKELLSTHEPPKAP